MLAVYYLCISVELPCEAGGQGIPSPLFAANPGRVRSREIAPAQAFFRHKYTKTEK